MRRSLLAPLLLLGMAAAPSDASWREKARVDVAAMATALRDTYIYAVYPDPARFSSNLDRIVRQIDSELPTVHDDAGYRAVLQHFRALLHDPHVQLSFHDPQVAVAWPGFLARFRNGGYVVTHSEQPAASDGTALTACDGKPIAAWVDTIARYEIGLPTTLETTRMEAALRLFVDRGSPLRPRPAHCTIGGHERALAWRPIELKQLQPTIWRWQGWRSNPEVSTQDFGVGGAWVKLGYFSPENQAQADAFRAAIAAAATLRGKRFIVLDVRGNGGGPYNWFVAYLRGLYGARYADYYATARLHIRGVYRLTPRTIAADAADGAQAKTLAEPADPPFEANDRANDLLQTEAVAAGKPYFQVKPLSFARTGTPPVNPVRAEVLVLTDYGCASACIGFVDELKRFPGVQQIGLPTFVDSRSGTAIPVPLPSGMATVRVAMMTRDGRERGDNVSQTPAIRFAGDIDDDDAVESWIRTLVKTRRRVR